MDIKLTSIKVNDIVSQINCSIFKDIWDLQYKKENIVFLKDTYYNSFYDGEISLFWLNFKNYFYSRSLIEGLILKNNFSQIIFEKNLTRENKLHVIKFKHENKVDFFTNFKDNNPDVRKSINLYQINSEQYSFYSSYFNRCGDKEKWRFVENNINNLLPEVMLVGEEYQKENLYLIKIRSEVTNNITEQCLIKANYDIDNFNSIIEKLSQSRVQQNILIDFKNIKDDLFDEYMLILMKNKESNLKFFIIVSNRKKIENNIFFQKKINSSIVFSDNSNINSLQITIENIDAVLLLNLVKSRLKEIDKSEYELRYKYKKIMQDIFSYIYLGTINFKRVKLFFEQLFKTDAIFSDILKAINNIESGNTKNIWDIENDLVGYLKSNNIKKIYLGKNNFIIKNYDLNNLIENIESICNEKNLDVSICSFNKSYPLSISNDSCLLYIGKDNISKYFVNKINCISIILNNNNNKNNNNYNYIDEDIAEDRSESNFSLHFNKSSLKLKGYKKVLYYNNNNSYPKDIYFDSVEDIYQQNIEDLYILDDLSLIKSYCEAFLKQKNKKNEIKKQIKKVLLELKYEKTRELLRRDYYIEIADKIIEGLDNSEKIYAENIRRNIQLWVENNNLPRKKELFLILLKYVGLGNEAERLYFNRSREISSNQKDGRNTMREIEDIFNYAKDEDEEYCKLIEKLLASNEFKKVIKIKEMGV